MPRSRSTLAVASQEHMIPFACLFAPATAVAWRLWGDLFLGRADLVAHLRFALSARRELAAGQWPLAFLNDAGVGFQPFFLYYSVLPFYMAGFAQLALGVTPYESVLLVAGLCFIVSGLGVALVCRYLRIGIFPATVAACAYAFCPYAFDNLYARGAIPELCANALLPAGLYAFLRCYATGGRRGFWPSIVATGALLLTHKIVFPWFLASFSLFGVVVGLAPGTHLATRLKRVCARGLTLAWAIVIAFALTAPYWMEAFMSVQHMMIAKYIGTYYEQLTQGLRILWPFYQEAPGADGTTLALQLGAPAALGIAVGVVAKRGSVQWGLGIVGLISAGFVAAGAGVWQHVPWVFTSIQFPYRLLAQTTLFGTLSFGLGLQHLLRSRLGRTRPDLVRLAGGASVVLVAATALQFDHALPYPPHPQAALFESDERTETLLHSDFVELPDSTMQAIMTNPLSAFQPEFGTVEAEIHNRFYGHDNTAPDAQLVPRTAVHFSGYTAQTVLTVAERTHFVLPAQYSEYVSVTEVDGRGNAVNELETENSDGKVAIWLDQGMHALRLTREIPIQARLVSIGGFLAAALTYAAGRVAGKHGQRGHGS